MLTAMKTIEQFAETLYSALGKFSSEQKKLIIAELENIRCGEKLSKVSVQSEQETDSAAAEDVKIKVRRRVKR